MAGEDRIPPPGPNDQCNAPSGRTAYNRLSNDPKYSVPSVPTAGEDVTAAPVAKVQRRVPS